MFYSKHTSEELIAFMEMSNLTADDICNMSAEEIERKLDELFPK